MPDPLNIIMSLSPRLRRGSGKDEKGGHLYQKKCVQAWIDAGAQPISINAPDEIALLEDNYRGVVFIESITAETENNPKRLPSIPEIVSVGVQHCANEVFAIVNSDVHYRGDRQTLSALMEAAKGGALFSHRFEQAPISNYVGLPYLYGFDVFFLDKKYLLPAEMEGFFIGGPWWDYLFLYQLAARDVPLSKLISPLMSHSTHEQAWSDGAWRRGLYDVAVRLRTMAVDEGPVAALLAFMCRSLEPEAQPGFGMKDIVSNFGIALGTAMVSYIGERCHHVLWLDDRHDMDDVPVSSKQLRRAAYEHAMSVL